jgi:hypothetical protein
MGCLTVEGFFSQTRLAFSDPRLRQKALSELNRTKQRSRPFNEFINEFNRLILEAEGWSWDDPIKKGYLKAAISLKLLQSTVGLQEDESYEGYCSQLRMVSDQLVEIQEISSRRTAWKKDKPTLPQHEPGSEAMDWEPSTGIAAARTKKKEPRWASPEETNRRREEGLCLRCGKEGHIVRHCKAILKTTKKRDVNVAATERVAVRDSDSENSGKE